MEYEVWSLLHEDAPYAPCIAGVSQYGAQNTALRQIWMARRERFAYLKEAAFVLVKEHQSSGPRLSERL